MSVLFNDLLAEAGVDPKDVRLLRHHTTPGIGGQSVYDLWRRDLAGFETYQRVQTPDRRIFRTGKVWAAFVSPGHGRTLFVGLYDTKFIETKPARWICPYEGRLPGAGKPLDIFATQLKPELAHLIGKLEIEWDYASIRTWARYASTARFPVIASKKPASSPPVDTLGHALFRLGFLESHSTKKMIRFQRGGICFYLKRENARHPLVLHPRYFDLAHEIGAIPDVAFDTPLRPYINSNMTAFPVYESPDRQTRSRFGFAITATSEVLPSLIARLEAQATLLTPDGEVRLVGSEEVPLTERERLAAARVGQGEFRTALIGLWGSCPVAGVDDLQLLRASHIKPWRDASNSERLDPHNGLLLCAHVDALFDRGLITFSDDGQVVFSDNLSLANRERLGLTDNMRISGLGPAHGPYLAHHRAFIFQAG